MRGRRAKQVNTAPSALTPEADSVRASELLVLHDGVAAAPGAKGGGGEG